MLHLHWDCDYSLDLHPVMKVLYGWIYAMSEPELAALCSYIQENLA